MIAKTAALVADATACSNKRHFPGSWADTLSQHRHVDIIAPRMLTLPQAVKLLQRCAAAEVQVERFSITIPAGWLTHALFSKSLASLRSLEQLHLELLQVQAADLKPALPHLRHVLNACSRLKQLHLHIPRFEGEASDYVAALRACPASVTDVGITFTVEPQQQEEECRGQCGAGAMGFIRDDFPGGKLPAAPLSIRKEPTAASLQQIHVDSGLAELIEALQRLSSSTTAGTADGTPPPAPHLLTQLQAISIKQPVELPELLQGLMWATKHSIRLTASLNGMAASYEVQRGGFALSQLAKLVAAGRHVISMCSIGQADVVQPEVPAATQQQLQLLESEAVRSMTFRKLEAAVVGHLSGEELEAALQRLLAALPECQQVQLQLCLPAGGSRTMVNKLQQSFLRNVRTLWNTTSIKATGSGGGSGTGIQAQQQEGQQGSGPSNSSPFKQRAAATAEKVRHLTLKLVRDESGAAWQLAPGTLRLLLLLAPQLESLELQLRCPEALHAEGVQQLQQLLAASSQLLRLKLSFFGEREAAQLLQPLVAADSEGRLVHLELFACSWVCGSSLAAATGLPPAPGKLQQQHAAGDEHVIKQEASTGNAVRLMSQLQQLQLLVVNPGGPEVEAQWPGWRPALLQAMGGQRVLFEHLGWRGGQEMARHSLQHWRGW